MTALPWPAGIETKVVHGLTKLISQLTTEIILLSGFPGRDGGELHPGRPAGDHH